jgi:hypothetical protein
MPQAANQILEQEFLQIRAKILEVAAFLDRLETARDDVSQDPKLSRIVSGCTILTDEETDKAARLQLLFSREYQPDWRETFSI